MRRLVCAATAALLSVGISAPAAGQSRQGGAPGDFSFYVLALTWSPGFCAGEGGRREREQCEPGRRLGFVVHGLWPQHERGFPTECGAAPRQPSRADVAEADGVFPDEGLARYQWRRHGTCSGLSPGAYFREARRARERVAIPALFTEASGGEATPRAIERAFAEANPGLRPDMVGVTCRRGALQEVRICFERDLRGFRSCPEVDRSGCQFGELRIEAPR